MAHDVHQLTVEELKAAAVAMKAIEQSIALRTKLTFEQEVAEAIKKTAKRKKD